MPAPTIEILYFDGCPTYAALTPEIRRLAAAEGARVELTAIETPEEAERARFLGSPSVRVDGVDVDPGAGGRDDYGMKCRLYLTPDGHRPAPPAAWVSAALRRARERRRGA